MSFSGGRRRREVYGRPRVEATSAARAGSVNVRNETPGAVPIGVVFGAEGLAQQPLLSLDASEQGNERQHSNNDAHARAERQPPPKHENEETKVARVANDPVEPATDQSVFGLDRNQA